MIVDFFVLFLRDAMFSVARYRDITHTVRSGIDDKKFISRIKYSDMNNVTVENMNICDTCYFDDAVFDWMT